MSASIGVALCEPGEGVDGERLIEDADAAMYRAKERGGARTELFDIAMRDRAVESLAIEQELQQAIEQGELRLFYQPAVDLSTGEVVGAEALVRWQHLVASAVEHPATLAACRTAAREGAALDLVPVDGEGRIAAADLAAALREDTALVALVHGQPDIGTLQDVPSLVAAARAAQPGARMVVERRRDRRAGAGQRRRLRRRRPGDRRPGGRRPALGRRAGRAARRPPAPPAGGGDRGGRQARRRRGPPRDRRPRRRGRDRRRRDGPPPARWRR